MARRQSFRQQASREPERCGSGVPLLGGVLGVAMLLFQLANQRRRDVYFDPAALYGSGDGRAENRVCLAGSWERPQVLNIAK